MPFGRSKHVTTSQMKIRLFFKSSLWGRFIFRCIRQMKNALPNCILLHKRITEKNFKNSSKIY